MKVILIILLVTGTCFANPPKGKIIMGVNDDAVNAAKKEIDAYLAEKAEPREEISFRIGKQKRENLLPTRCEVINEDKNALAYAAGGFILGTVLWGFFYYQRNKK